MINTKVIFFVNAWAMAHVSRAVEISKHLRNLDYDITIAGTGTYLDKAKEEFTTVELDGPTKEEVMEIFQTNNIKSLLSYSRLSADLNSGMELCHKVKPHLILSDNRIMSRTIGDLLNLPVISIMNAHITNYQKYPFQTFIKEPKYIPQWLLDKIYSWQIFFEQNIMDKFFFNHLKQIRKENNLKSLFAYEHEEGHLTLIPDIPEFNPTANLPEHLQYVGPITWKSDNPAPLSLKSRDSKIPLIYFSLGSQSLNLNTKLLELIKDLPYHFLFAKGHTELGLSIPLPKNVYIEDFVNMDLVLPQCQAILCHGGNGTIYKALQYGVPIICIPSHNEQSQNARQVDRLKLGYVLSYSEKKNEEFEIINALNKLLKNSEINSNVCRFSEKLKTLDGSLKASQIIDEYFKSKLPTNVQLKKLA